MHTKWCLYIFFFVISLKKVWKFDYLVFFARNNFWEIVLAKNIAGINFREIVQNSGNSRKLLPTKFSLFKIVNLLQLKTLFSVQFL